MTIFALDIETDTSPLTEAEKAAGFTARGLDPRITPVTAVAMHAAGSSHVIHATDCADGEAGLLERVGAFMIGAGASRDSGGVLVTWNGSVFDLPFLIDRARILEVEDWFSGLELTPDESFAPKYDPLPGHAGGYRATWCGLPHIDMAYVDKDECLAAGVSWSLKPWAKHLGMDPVEVDRSRMHELTREELDAYVASDARITHDLAVRHSDRSIKVVP